jgi:DnaB-like helicase N terminal domain/AAA domain
MSDSSRPLPHNRTAEMSVLGAILLDNKSIEAAVQHVKAEDFLFPNDRALFRAMRELHQAQMPIDFVTLEEYLRKHSQLDEGKGTGVGGLTVAYMTELIDGVPRTSNVAYYADIVAEKSRRRQIISIAQSFQNSAWEDGEKSSVELLNEWERVAQDIRPTNGNGNGNGHFAYSLKEFMTTEFPEPAHLIEKLIPCNNNSIIVAMPHNLKSYFMLGLALAATHAGNTVLGCLEVKRPVRTVIMQVEEHNGELQNRLRQFLLCPQFAECDMNNIRIVPRTSFDKDWYPKLLRETTEFGADWVILDVFRRFFVGFGDPNSSKDTAEFLEKLEVIRNSVGCHITLVCHENRKDAEISAAVSGNGNLQGWAKSWIRLKRKVEDKIKGTTSVEVEVDTGLTSSLEPMRLVLDFGSTENRLRLENLEDDTGFRDVMEAMASEFTVRDIAEHKGVHRTNAWRLVKKWLDEGRIEKVRGRRGRGGMAAYKEIEIEKESSPEFPPVHVRRIQ